MSKATPEYTEARAAKPSFVTDGGKDGFDLEVIVRQVLVQLMDDRGWSQNEAASAMGVPQRTLGRFLNGEGMRLDTLSTIMAQLETTPIRFLESHPALTRSSRTRIRAVRDHAFDRFRTALSPGEQDRWLELIERLNERRLLPIAAAALEAILDAAKTGRRQAFSEARKRKSKPS